mmetsp:Transcript_104808/g.325730  ORF Transcript_104808/g.325730 Transcript_104808/m.325730 type:complete len:239 (-) Transcript_104808:1001-1717(-)
MYGSTVGDLVEPEASSAHVAQKARGLRPSCNRADGDVERHFAGREVPGTHAAHQIQCLLGLPAAYARSNCTVVCHHIWYHMTSPCRRQEVDAPLPPPAFARCADPSTVCDDILPYSSLLHFPHQSQCKFPLPGSRKSACHRVVGDEVCLESAALQLSQKAPCLLVLSALLAHAEGLEAPPRERRRVGSDRRPRPLAAGGATALYVAVLGSMAEARNSLSSARANAVSACSRHVLTAAL